MIPHNGIVTVPVKWFAGVCDRCNRTLQAFVRRLLPAAEADRPTGPSAPSARDSDAGGCGGRTQPTPAGETGPDRGWVCERCETVHASDPTACPNCGFTVFEPASPAPAAEDDTVGSDWRVSSVVVTKVAEREGVQPAELDTPLYEAIDPDALDSLVPAMAEDGTVLFDYHDYDVRVTGDGDVVIEDRS